jgi:diguanylate cyclase (GGDEF)-like protein/PAS domain S-box-containing protein
MADTRVPLAVASAVLAMLGVTVLAGWALGIPALAGMLADVPGFEHAIAAAFVAAGIALFLVHDGERAEALGRGTPTPLLRAAQIGGAVVALTGAAGVLGHQDGATALGLLLGGIGILLLAQARTRRWAEFFGLAALVTAVLGLLAFLYGSGAASGQWAHMQPAAALGLLLLAGATVAALPSGRMMGVLSSPDLGGKTARRLLVPAIGIPIAFSLVRLQLQRAGWYGLELGLALMLTATTVTLVAVIWWSARWLDRVARDREQALAAARDSEARFRSLTGLSSDWYWEQDEHFRFTFVSEHGPAARGRTPANPLGRTRWDLALDGPEADWAAHRATVEAHRPFRDFEYQALDAEGTPRWYSSSGEPVFDRDGRFAGYRGVSKDITATKRAEEALRLANRAVEASANGIMVTEAGTPGNPIVYVNPAFERITGYTAREVVDRNPSFLHAEDSDQFGIEEIRAALREEREGTAVLRNYRKDGTLFWNELSVAPVRDSDGRLTHWVGITEDVTARKRYERALEHQASHDALTRLANRSLLEDRTRQAMALAARTHRSVAVLVLDLDNFKPINDTLGHAAGDAVLQGVAERLSASVRGADTVARLGGDEFAVVLVELGREEDAVTVARKMLDAVAQPIPLGGRELRVTASIGISMFPRDGDRTETLLRKADAAMYEAKTGGRNAFRIYAPA